MFAPYCEDCNLAQAGAIDRIEGGASSRKVSNMKRTVFLGILAVPLIACAAQASTHKTIHHARRHVHPTGIGVQIDEAKMVSFARPAKTVFVGNPWIADVSMLDSRHAFVLGKTMGLTNLIVLDANGAPIENKPIMVTNTFAATTLNRGPDQFNYSCTLAHCETAPRPGDPKVYVDNSEQAATQHEGFGAKSAVAPSGVQSPSPAD